MTTTAITTAALVRAEPVFSGQERLALAGFLAGYSGMTREAYALDLRQFTAWCHTRYLPPLRRPPRRHRALRARTRERRAGPGHGHPAAIHHRRALQVRGRGEPARPFPGRARPPAAHRLRVPRHRPGPQRGRRPAGRRRARRARRARADLPARPQWAACVRGHRRRHRGPRHRARPPDPRDPPQGRQESGHPARPAHRPRDRPRHRRALRRADLRHRVRGAARPARRRPRRPPRCAPRRAGQEDRAAYAAPCVHNCSARCGVPLRDVQEAASHADPRTTIRYDRARVSLDRHATYIVAAYIAGAAR